MNAKSLTPGNLTISIQEYVPVPRRFTGKYQGQKFWIAEAYS